MVRPVTIALDAMGGDKGAHVCVPAGIEMLREREELRLIFVGPEDTLAPLVAKSGIDDGRLRIVNASEVVGMDEHPRDALRKKKNSSIRVAVDLVKDGEAEACVSSGNTGALMATARFVLKTLPGIDRPAILALMPTKHGRLHMLDLGANSDCTSEHLFQFAVMGSVVAHVQEGMESPRIGLLNIGAEDIKGNDMVRQAAAMLADSDLNYCGFVEGNDIPNHTVDVVVCDGFSGNVALKSMEGTADLIRHHLKKQFKSGMYSRLAATVAWPVLNALSARLDPRRYNGATLVGLNGIVIKSHGGADVVAFKQAIHTAMLEADVRVPDQIRKLLEEQGR